MLILASQSPRRKILLKSYGYKFKAISPNIDESTVLEKDPIKVVKYLAYKKAEAVFKNYKDAVVIAADTLVYKDQTFFGKPKDLEDAMSMLKTLSGSVHQVYTGVCILSNTHQEIFHTVSNVTFKSLDENAIKTYVDTYRPLDKAGAYGIQEENNILVDHYDGDFLTIVGFPMKSIKPKLDIILKK